MTVTGEIENNALQNWGTNRVRYGQCGNGELLIFLRAFLKAWLLWKREVSWATVLHNK